MTDELPQIAKLKPGDTFEMIIPECCRLFAEADSDEDIIKAEKNCPHVKQKDKIKKTNIGL